MAKPKSLVPYLIISSILVMFALNVAKALPEVQSRYRAKAPKSEIDRMSVSVRAVDVQFAPGVVYRVVWHELSETGVLTTLLAREGGGRRSNTKLIESDMYELLGLQIGTKIIFLPIENKMIVLPRYQA